MQARSARLIPSAVENDSGIFTAGRHAGHLLHDPGIDVLKHLGVDLITTGVLAKSHLQACCVQQRKLFTDLLDRIGLRIATKRNEQWQITNSGQVCSAEPCQREIRRIARSRHQTGMGSAWPSAKPLFRLLQSRLDRFGCDGCCTCWQPCE